MLAWPEDTMYEAIEAVANDGPDRTAVVFDDRTVTFEALLEESRALAASLAELGVDVGDVIAIWLANRPEWIVAQLAASYLGAATVAVNTRYRRHELEYALVDSGASVLLTESTFLGRDFHGMVADVVPEVRSGSPGTFDPDAIPTLDAVVSLDPAPNTPAMIEYASLLESSSPEPDHEPASDPSAPTAIFYTSGTTSDPKGCVQSNRSLLNHSHHAAGHLGVTGDDVGVATLPFPGIWGYNYVFGVLSHGATLVTNTHFDPVTTIRSIDDHEGTYVTGLGVMFERMLAADEFDRARVSTVERGIVGFISHGYDEALFERIEESFGFPVVQPYGLSEANSQVFVGDPADPIDRRKRVGGPLVHSALEAKIVDPESRTELPDGDRGELALRGYNVMDGYLGKPTKTAEVMDEDGWLYTGDLCSRAVGTVGETEEQETITYHARLDDVLRVRGFLVSPTEIASAVEECTGVDRSAVVGAPHPEHGAVPVAFVIPSDESPTAEAIESALAERMADYKVPAAIEFVDGFPTTEGPNGEKIQLGVLRDRVQDRFAE